VFILEVFVFVVEKDGQYDVIEVGETEGNPLGLFVCEGCFVGELTTTPFATWVVPWQSPEP